MAFRCPSCGAQLLPMKTEMGILWPCPACSGRMATWGLLRRIVAAGTLDRLWKRADATRKGLLRSCPSCSKPMARVAVATDTASFEIDLCRRCQLSWFDAGEFSQFPIESSQLPVEARMMPQMRRELAMLEVERIAEQGEIADGDPLPADLWKMFPAVFGLPIEMKHQEFVRRPVVAWLVVLVIGIVSGIAFLDLPLVIGEFGLIPAEWWRLGGATLFTSFFIHGSVIHLVGNLYFLVIFGDNVEEALGRSRFLLMLLLATLGGDLLHILFDPRSQLPCIGASGGISGVLAFYALRFPHAKIAVFGWSVGWLRLPAFAMFCLWLCLQLMISLLQLSGIGSVSALAHIGGILVGVAFWWRM